MDGESRGFHAHISLQQVLIAVSGSVKVKCINSKGDEEIFVLNTPEKGLLLQGLVWREMFDFSEGAVLLVLASENYNEEDYVRSYQKFVSLCANT